MFDSTSTEEVAENSLGYCHYSKIEKEEEIEKGENMTIKHGSETLAEVEHLHDHCYNALLRASKSSGGRFVIFESGHTCPWKLLDPTHPPYAVVPMIINFRSMSQKQQEEEIVALAQKVQSLPNTTSSTPRRPSRKTLPTVVVTRHEALVDYMIEKGALEDSLGENIPFLSQATAEDVCGKRVIGVLPLSLAAEAAEVVVANLENVPKELRGTELSLEQLREYCSGIDTYVVSKH